MSEIIVVFVWYSIQAYHMMWESKMWGEGGGEIGEITGV